MVVFTLVRDGRSADAGRECGEEEHLAGQGAVEGVRADEDDVQAVDLLCAETDDRKEEDCFCVKNKKRKRRQKKRWVSLGFGEKSWVGGPNGLNDKKDDYDERNCPHVVFPGCG